MNSQRASNRSGSHISGLVVGLVALLATSHASGSSAQAADLPYHLRATPGQAWNPVDRLAVRTVSDKGRQSDQHGSYDPSVVYPGIYESDQVYKMLAGPQTWAGSRRPARVQHVTCRDARTALERKGLWNGALNAAGDCRSGEPTDWAIGNFLNFQAGLEDGESSL